MNRKRVKLAFARKSGNLFILRLINMKVQFFNLTILVLIFCCSCNVESEQNHTNIKNISIEIEDAESYKYEDLIDTSTATYARLQTSKESLLGEIRKMHIFNEKFVFVSNKLFIFDEAGSFLFCLNKEGRGPGEYLHLTDAYIDGENNIYILDKRGRKIVKYDVKGDHLVTFKTGLIGLSFTKLNDDIWAIYSGSEKTEVSSNSVNYYSESTEKIIFGAQNISDEQYNWMHILENDNFTRSPVSPLYKSVFNDTLYTLANDKISPSFFLD